MRVREGLQLLLPALVGDLVECIDLTAQRVANGAQHLPAQALPHKVARYGRAAERRLQTDDARDPLVQAVAVPCQGGHGVAAAAAVAHEDNALAGQHRELLDRRGQCLRVLPHALAGVHVRDAAVEPEAGEVVLRALHVGGVLAAEEAGHEEVGKVPPPLQRVRPGPGVLEQREKVARPVHCPRVLLALPLHPADALGLGQRWRGLLLLLLVVLVGIPSMELERVLGVQRLRLRRLCL
mmetsp:Transcript_67555/g.200874  ORF Transcript_67555/g.200874 Transcript_67555/m.200874 type:complete len:238 (-) Transcript_67555:296-1009(-)